MADKMQSSMRQKVTIGLFIVVVLIVLWQASGLFGGGGGASTSTASPTSTSSSATKPNTPAARAAQVAAMKAKVAEETPQPTQLPKSELTTAREKELMRMQEETQVKYMAALNELQMLKINKDIAETNQAIVTAKLSMVEAQKKIVDTLAPPPAPTQETYVQGLAGGSAIAPANSKGNAARMASLSEATEAVKYTVISVSRLQNRWTAVLGAKGNLYSIHVGDILPLDQAVVKAIDRSGVMINRNGNAEMISLVPVI